MKKLDLINIINASGLGTAKITDLGSSRGSIIEVNSIGNWIEPWMFIAPTSSLGSHSAPSTCFWGVTSAVLQYIQNLQFDYGLMLIDTKGSVYVYDCKSTNELLKKVSRCKKYGNYKILESDLDSNYKLNLDEFNEFVNTGLFI